MNQSLETALNGTAPEMAARLLGCHLVRTFSGQTVTLRIVETEAYDQTDAASHSYKGRTARTDVMFGPAGHLYVYFTYGMHYCCNVVVGHDGEGAGVLIRAAEPLGERHLLEQRRPVSGVQLTNGPAKLCQALDVTKTLNNHDLAMPPLQLILQPPVSVAQRTQTTRVGISQAKDVPWRFYLTGNPYVSKTG